MIDANYKCTTCKACIQTCPVKCIGVDAFGRIEVDHTSCINCGVCDKVCQITNDPEFLNPTFIYAAYSRNKQALMQSSSGGMGGLLLRNTLKKGFKVFSAVNDKNANPIIDEVWLSNIDDTLRSKYCFSDIKDSYIKCKEYLIKGEKVLFIALPCQIGGLKLFLRKTYTNLYCVDLFCHGAPASIELSKHLSYKNSLKKRNVLQVEFRDKRFSKWGEYCIGYVYDDGTITHKPALCDYYFSNFIKGTFFRECCYICKYARFERIGDISIGDYWHYKPKTLDPLTNGISAVLINSEKGIQLWNLIQDECMYEQGSRESVEMATHAVVAPMERPKDYMSHMYMSQEEYNKIAKDKENSLKQLCRLLKFKLGF